MAFYDSQLSVFLIDNTAGAQQDISQYIVAIDGLPGPRELSEATALGDTGRKWHPSLQNATITLELMWSEDATTGPDTVFGPLREHTAAVDFEYGPEGKVSPDIKYSGTCWVRNYTIQSRIGTMVLAKVELAVEGAVARGAY